MMYPFMKLDDNTEIVHSEMLENEKVKVYIEKPIKEGFASAVCYMPDYDWQEIEGFSSNEIEKFQEFLESVAHLIIQFAKDGGFDSASNF